MHNMTAKRFLGQLCVNGHDYNGTGRSLRYKKGFKCVVCHSDKLKSWISRNKCAWNAIRRRVRQNRSKARVKQEAMYQANYYIDVVKGAK